MHVDNSKQLPTVISFCSGYGGIERGLELAGIEHRVLAYVEIEAFAIANLVAKMEQGELVPAPIWTDIKTFPSDLFRDSVDIITGGYPCQPFSVAGRAQAFDDPRHLFPYILDHVRTIRPSQCFFENVEGHINRGLESVLQDLESAGYDSTWGIFSAEEVGAPHQRKRIFILANANGYALRKQSGGSSREDRTSETLSGVNGEARSMANSDSSRQLQSQGSESEQWGWTGDSDQEGSMADPNSNGEIRNQPKDWEGAWTEQGREELANPDSSLRLNVREQISEQGKKTQQRIGDSSGSTSEELANTINEGSQGGLQGRQDSQWKGEHGHTGRSSSAHRQQGSDIWDIEPNVGRVAHGITDRVDRLRLLGNGVVPQTAARAWEVLNARD